MMIIDPIGVYVHIPYCIRKCNYCDFCSLPKGGEGVPDAYVDRLVDEITAYRENDKIPASTLYFGGGTPSLLKPEQLEKIISALKLVFDFSIDLEFTIESNPGTVTADKLRAFKSLGCNRLSLGVQSMIDSELSSLGRIHTAKDSEHAFAAARAAGFGNVSLDLMYGIPGQSINTFRYTLERVLELSPEHLSVYGLIVEPGTPFFRERDSLIFPSEDEECDMYYMASDLLRERGYAHYEISNYAREGFSSRHNLKYWRAEEYIGIGASAASYFRRRRYVNTSRVAEYLCSRGVNYISDELIDVDTAAYEYAMMRLRLSEGVSLSDYRRRFGRDLLSDREEELRRLEALGLVTLDGDRFNLSERGFYLSNTILTEIL